MVWSAKAQLFDDFSDGDFTHNPAWTGDSLHFEVNSSGQLHLKSSGSDTSCLATPYSWMGESEWNFWLKLSFNSSANNFARVYLSADKEALSQPLNGYLIRVGGSTDSICFMKQTGDDFISLLCFPDYLVAQSTNRIRIKMTRSNNGQWTAWMDPAGGDDLIGQGTVFDKTYSPGNWFGFYCKYTSSNATKFYFDDVYAGPVIRDTVPPLLELLEIIGEDRLVLTFTENLEPLSALQAGNYLALVTGMYPVEVYQAQDQPDKVQLVFPSPFSHEFVDTLFITSLIDLSGNKMVDTLVPFTLFEPSAYDILIHEIMPDPDPPAGLPITEYIELFNNTDFPVNLTGWILEYGSQRKIFPAVTMVSHGFILVAADTSLNIYGQVVPLFTSGSSLSNEGTRITLRNSETRIIHTVQYSKSWFESSWKEEGGWSVEMVDVANPCGCEGNWKVSMDKKGGTPGKKNSVMNINPDLVPPSVVRSFFSAPDTWEIRFSESMDTTWKGIPELWHLEPGQAHPDSLVPVLPDYSSLRLIFKEEFAAGTIYTLRSDVSMKDCAGNIITQEILTQSAVPETVDRTDVIINEVLFDPWPGSSRFIELYNRSDKVVDLSDLAIVSADSDTAFHISGAKPLIGEPFLLFPFDYAAVCDHTGDVKSFYQTFDRDLFLEPSSFPSLKNEQGHLMLIRIYDEDLIEKMEYSVTMHYPLIYNTEGISLERINPDGHSGDPSNWHSAAESAGYATPAYLNSQWMNVSQTDDEISVEPPIFSPDNDGHDDVVSIQFRMENAGSQVSAVIYDYRGRLVRHLTSCSLTGQTGEILWDGINDDSGKAQPGIYIVYLEVVCSSGEVKKFREPIVVASQF